MTKKGLVAAMSSFVGRCLDGRVLGVGLCLLAVITTAPDAVLLRWLQLQGLPDCQIFGFKGILFFVCAWAFEVIEHGLFSIHRQAARRWDRTLIGLCFGAGIMMNTIATLLTTATEAQLLVYSAPMFAVVIGWVVLGDIPKPHSIAALVISMCCVVLLLVMSSHAASNTDHPQQAVAVHKSSLAGNALAVVCGMSLAALLVTGRQGRLAGVSPDPTYLGVAIGYLSIALAFIVVCEVKKEWVPLTAAAAAVILLDALCCASFVKLAALSLKYTDPVVASLLLQLDMLLAPALTMIVFGERAATSTYAIAGVLAATLLTHGVVDAACQPQTTVSETTSLKSAGPQTTVGETTSLKSAGPTVEYA